MCSAVICVSDALPKCWTRTDVFVCNAQAIVVRKVVCAEVYAVMDKVVELMVQTSTPSARELCRQVSVHSVVSLPERDVGYPEHSYPVHVCFLPDMRYVCVAHSLSLPRHMCFTVLSSLVGSSSLPAGLPVGCQAAGEDVELLCCEP